MHETRTSLLTATLIVLTACPHDDAPSDDEVASETATETQGDTETTDDTTDSTDAPDPMCGDGLVDAGEECDDGNDVDDDECTNACTTATCGDSIVQAGVETCDDGNVLDNDGCSGLCAIEECGDGIVQESEECDDGDPSNGNECTTFCMLAFCGDGFSWIGTEQCDDGNMDDTDACVNGCLNAVCGDGFTEVGVEECDDANMDDTDACPTGCLNALCGDGFTEVGIEECDDGNMDDDDDCDNGCLLPVCGDGVVEGAEECDDANADPLDGCAPPCMLESRLVFTTSSLHTGNLGGLVGADAICNMRAQAAGLPGTYLAWISTSRGTPASRFVHSTVPYFTTLGVKVADDWADLIDGTLDAPIQTTELMGPSPVGTNVCLVNNNPANRTTLTGTFSNGTLNGNNCSDFTADVGMVGVGVSTSSVFRWSNCANLDCANTAALYCFQK